MLRLPLSGLPPPPPPPTGAGPSPPLALPSCPTEQAESISLYSLLRQIGFQWELALEKQWNDKFEKLRVYHQTYGDSNVPYNFSEDPALGMWVKYQRDAMRRGRINPKYRELLDGLGFQWEPTLDKQWLDRFEKLKAFKEEYSHTSVPSTYKVRSRIGVFPVGCRATAPPPPPAVSFLHLFSPSYCTASFRSSLSKSSLVIPAPL